MKLKIIQIRKDGRKGVLNIDMRGFSKNEIYWKRSKINDS